MVLMLETFGRLFLYFAGLAVVFLTFTNQRFAVFAAIAVVVIGLLYQASLCFRYIRSQASSDSGAVKYCFTEQGCRVERTGRVQIFSWDELSQPSSHFSLLVFAIEKHSAARAALLDVDSKHLFRSLKRHLAGAPSLEPSDVSYSNLSHEFPVVWCLPVPVRPFLLIPARCINENLLRQVRQWISARRD